MFSPIHIHSLSPIHIHSLSPIHIHSLSPIHIHSLSPIHIHSLSPIHIHSLSPIPGVQLYPNLNPNFHMACVVRRIKTGPPAYIYIKNIVSSIYSICKMFPYRFLEQIRHLVLGILPLKYWLHHGIKICHNIQQYRNNVIISRRQKVCKTLKNVWKVHQDIRTHEWCQTYCMMSKTMYDVKMCIIRQKSKSMSLRQKFIM